MKNPISCLTSFMDNVSSKAPKKALVKAPKKALKNGSEKAPEKDFLKMIDFTPIQSKIHLSKIIFK